RKWEAIVRGTREGLPGFGQGDPLEVVERDVRNASPLRGQTVSGQVPRRNGYIVGRAGRGYEHRPAGRQVDRSGRAGNGPSPGERFVACLGGGAEVSIRVTYGLTGRG